MKDLIKKVKRKDFEFKDEVIKYLNKVNEKIANYADLLDGKVVSEDDLYIIYLIESYIDGLDINPEKIEEVYDVKTNILYFRCMRYLKEINTLMPKSVIEKELKLIDEAVNDLTVLKYLIYNYL